MARRLALIIGNSIFRDPSLARLLTPDADVGALADVLLNPEIGAFDDVKLVVNMAAASIRRAISQFFGDKTRDDLLLLYFSGHGVLDENGRLYLATKETERSYLRGTAIPAGFITDEMDHSRSRRQVLVLDCCHSGAFARGTKGAPGASVGTATAFEGKGYGRVVLTASDATQYAWEGDQVIGEAENSLFTHYLVQGLQTGQADTDADGTITVDELYDYIYSHVISQTPNQTPGKWSYKEQGEIILARAAAGGAPPPEQIDLPEFDDEIEAKLKRLYDTGLAAYWLDDWDRAARAFQAILDARPGYPGALDKLREARRNAELTGLYQTAQDALSSQDWRAAVSTLEALLAQAPDYRDAASQLKSAQQQAHLTDLYAEAHRLHQAEQWHAARRVLANIHEIDPGYPDPDGLQPAIDENIAALERRKKLENLYGQALAEIDAGSLENARDLLSQIQELEPGYAESEPLLAKVESLLQRRAEERQRQEQIDTLYRQAQTSARAEQWPQVLAKLEALRQLSPEFDDPDDLLTTAQHQLELAEQASQSEPETQAPAAPLPAQQPIWPQSRPAPTQPAKTAAPWYSQPNSFLRSHPWLFLSASILIILLAVAGLNAGGVFSSLAESFSSSTTFRCSDSVACVTYAPDEPIRIASALVSSGPNAQLGMDSQYGIEIALQFRGPVLGHDVELQAEDSGCNFESGQIVGQNIVSDPSILGLIGTSCSTAAIPMSQLISEAGYFMVSPSNTAPSLTDPDGNWNPGYLRTAHNDRLQGAVMADFAIHVLNVTTAAAIHDGDPYTEGLATEFALSFEDSGGKIVELIAKNVGEIDMRPALEAVSAAGPPELLYYPVFTSECALLTHQAREVPGLEGTHLAAADGCISGDAAQAIGPAGDGMLFSGPDISFEGRLYERFNQAYRENYGADTMSVFHAHAFDATNMILDCVEQVAIQQSDGTLHIGRQAIRDCLYATRDFLGITGNLTCSEFGDCADPKIAIYQLQAGEYQRIWP